MLSDQVTQRKQRKVSIALIMDYVILAFVALCLLSSVRSSASLETQIRANHTQTKKNFKQIHQLKNLIEKDIDYHDNGR